MNQCRRFPSTELFRCTLILCGLLAGAVVISGCGRKKAETGAEVPTPPPVAVAPADQPPTGAPVAPPQSLHQPAPVAQSDGQVDMPELNRCLLRWVLANRRRPANFEDFAATAGVTIPPPPAGKKYILNPDMHIVLVNQ